MAITKLNSLAIPPNTIVESDLSYPLTNFSSTGIDDNATSTAITINSSQNVGIGTASPTQKLELSNDSSAVYILQSRGTTNPVQQIMGPNGTSAASTGQIGTTSNHGFRFVTNNTEHMRIDSSGNVGIGTASPTELLHIAESTGTSTLRSQNNSGSFYFGIDNSTGGTFSTGNYSRVLYSGGAYPMVFATNNAERMRIDSSGNLLVGTTDNSSATGTVSGIRLLANGIFTAATSSESMYISRRTTTGAIIQFRYNTTNVGTISTNGSTTSYNVSSDYRLKENIVSLDNATDRLKQIPVHRFNFIADPDTTVDGFIAHEVADVVPEAITGEKDGMRTEEYEITPEVIDDDGNVIQEAVMGTREVPDYQGIDQSKLVPLLTAALQEALTKIDDLETRLSALEAN